MATPLTAWLSAFAFTQAVEVPLYVIAFRRSALHAARPRSLATYALLGFAASAITHPFVWFFLPWIGGTPYAQMVLRAETFAIVVEGFYLFVLGAFDLKRSLLWSLVINATSASVGLLSRSLFHWP